MTILKVTTKGSNSAADKVFINKERVNVTHQLCQYAAHHE